MSVVFHKGSQDLQRLIICCVDGRSGKTCIIESLFHFNDVVINHIFFYRSRIKG
ncbi:hypothetical protein KsCSTR_43060 [Candidatus Kuenenia stuttgartiensis]|uniref:Uncharacterized protein n=1 Tax=Kuenenia stuttgartiensis TaxID=174633 RepID=Q1PX66_KUEST|nr:hypothetical protein KsCSTR_43060 [Candidatus Kuenenia stuttgartiensis]CAJ71825.1 unknown protein [Candidatus Kuenenia stuttgartiensis]